MGSYIRKRVNIGIKEEGLLMARELGIFFFLFSSGWLDRFFSGRFFSRK